MYNKFNSINIFKALDKIKNSNGRIFSIEFTKKDGSNRVLNCRTGVKSGLTGKGLPYDPMSKGLLCVYDVKNKGYRMVNLARLKSLRINKEVYPIEYSLFV